MDAMNSETAPAWQIIANNVSRQRPSAGQPVTVMTGRKHKGKTGRVLVHRLDKYVDAFRYGNTASHAYREMAGRYGYVVQVVTEAQEKFWVKAEYVMVHYPYGHWTTALVDALLIEGVW